MTNTILLLIFFSVLALLCAALIFAFRSQPAVQAVGVVIGALALFGVGAAFPCASG